MNLESLSKTVREARTLSIRGTGTKAGFCLPVLADFELDMTSYEGVVSHEPADQVVCVRAGTTIEELQEELARHSLCLPLPAAADHGVLLAGFPGTVGGLVAMNLPHGLFAQCGGPRDWVLGLTVLRGDGSVAKSGSKVVKSVAGFDVHKLFVGARGTLGVVVEVTFRTYPVRALPACAAVSRRAYAGGPLEIRRVLPSGYHAALEEASEGLLASDEASGTLWVGAGLGEKPSGGGAEHGQAVDVASGGWVLRSGFGTANLDEPAPEVAAMMKKTKAALDPEGVFNPGAMGVV